MVRALIIIEICVRRRRRLNTPMTTRTQTKALRSVNGCSKTNDIPVVLRKDRFARSGQRLSVMRSNCARRQSLRTGRPSRYRPPVLLRARKKAGPATCRRPRPLGRVSCFLLRSLCYSLNAPTSSFICCAWPESSSADPDISSAAEALFSVTEATFWIPVLTSPAVCACSVVASAI